jgi:hypothetical protein
MRWVNRVKAGKVRWDWYGFVELGMAGEVGKVGTDSWA